MNHVILELARTVQQRPNDGAAVHRLVDALRKDGDLPALAAMIECWASVVSGAPKPALAMGTLYSRLAEGATPDTARQLCVAALDLSPGSAEALSRFERLARPEDVDELCNRYIAFLACAPFHPISPRVRVKLIDRLVEAGRYDEALEQVKTLPPRSAVAPVSDEIESACAITPPPPAPTEYLEEDPWEHTQILDDMDIQFMDLDAPFRVS